MVNLSLRAPNAWTKNGAVETIVSNKFGSRKDLWVDEAEMFHFMKNWRGNPFFAGNLSIYSADRKSKLVTVFTKRFGKPEIQRHLAGKTDGEQEKVRALSNEVAAVLKAEGLYIKSPRKVDIVAESINR